MCFRQVSPRMCYLPFFANPRNKAIPDLPVGNTFLLLSVRPNIVRQKSHTSLCFLSNHSPSPQNLSEGSSPRTGTSKYLVETPKGLQNRHTASTNPFSPELRCEGRAGIRTFAAVERWTSWENVTHDGTSCSAQARGTGGDTHLHQPMAQHPKHFLLHTLTELTC